MIFNAGNSTRFNLNTELFAQEPSLYNSGMDKKAKKAAKEAVKKYNEERGIKNKTIWSRIKGAFKRK